jgi:hypothetical protein
MFTTTDSALAYFNDQVLELGALRPGSNGLIDLTFDLSLRGHVAGDGFAIDLAVANVPEPRSVVLLAAGLALVFGLARRRASTRLRGRWLRRLSLDTEIRRRWLCGLASRNPAAPQIVPRS